MQEITLPGSDIRTTRLGFGCNNLLGNKTRTEGLGLLNTAYDAGVRHFDVARYYGFGEAESLVGEFAKGKRDQITITTKFGIQPPAPASSSFIGLTQKYAIQLSRRVIRASSFVRNMARRNLGHVVKTGQFDLATARASLDKSLQELGTEYIDIYLLHDCDESDCTPELLAFLDGAVSDGKIRAFGAGTSLESVRAILAEHPSFADVLQFNSDAINRNAERLVSEWPRDMSRCAVITHGAVGKVRSLLQASQSESGRADELEKLAAVDARDPATLSALVLQHALHANPEGIVLLRSESDDRIKSNVHAAEEPAFSPEQLASFAAFAAEFAD